MPGWSMVALGVVMVMYALVHAITLSEIGYQGSGTWLGVVIPALFGVVAMYVGRKRFQKELEDEMKSAADSWRRKNG